MTQDLVAYDIEVDVGPAIASGVDFRGCTDWSGAPDSCACETWRPVVCARCGREIHDGDMVGSVDVRSWLVGSDEDVEWENDTWHVECP